MRKRVVKEYIKQSWEKASTRLETPTFSESSFRDIFRSAMTRSRRNMMGMGNLLTGFRRTAAATVHHSGTHSSGAAELSSKSGRSDLR